MERKISRSQNAKRNIVSGIINKLLFLFLPFLIRTVIIEVLGAEYLGLSSLFTSILQVLNMAELGFSSAVVFSLYEPMAEGETDEICALLSFYRSVYKIVGIIITVVGLILLPLLPHLIKGSYPMDINLYVLYLIYLANTSISYFTFAYKNVLLTAAQRQDVLSNIDSILSIIRYTIQICALFIWKNYYLYIIWNFIFTVITNVMIAMITKKYYPDYYCRGRVNKEKKRSIIQQIKGLAIGKFSLVARNSFDSIVLSAFCGLVDVAIYSNYYYILSAITGFITVLVQALQAGIGNSVAVESLDKNYFDYKRFYFIFSWIGGFCAICLYCLYQPFMRMWVGRELTASHLIMSLFCVYFYIGQMGQVRGMYAGAAGIWWEFRKYEIAEMVANLALNFGLGYLFGMTGILWATIITVTIFSLVGITNETFKVYFKRSSLDYWKDSFVYICITVMTGTIVCFICNMMDIEGIGGLILKGAICLVTINVVFFGLAMISRQHRNYLVSVFHNLMHK